MSNLEIINASIIMHYPLVQFIPYIQHSCTKWILFVKKYSLFALGFQYFIMCKSTVVDGSYAYVEADVVPLIQIHDSNDQGKSQTGNN